MHKSIPLFLLPLLILGCHENTRTWSRSKSPSSIKGWLEWRGPTQDGVSTEKKVISQFELNGKGQLWSYDIAGGGTPVIANDRLYVMGYDGEGQDLQETLLCLDIHSGKKHWELRINDFLSDIIYNRYAIGSPAIDPDTGNIYIMSSAGLFIAVSPKGKRLWEYSLMEEYGRLSFPNGRTGSPVIDGDLVIVRGITTFWGKQGPARDRFYAFDKRTGRAVWHSTPGVRPRDSSFSTPVFAWLGNKRVFYVGTGCGNIVCVNARTGEPIARFQFSRGGVNSTVLVRDDHSIISIHHKENLDTAKVGRMVCVQMGVTPKPGQKGPLVLNKSAEKWRNHLSIFTSSPVMVGDKIYQIIHSGSLCCIDAVSGKLLWKKKLSNFQLHASPTYADGKLYVPFLDGSFYVLRPHDTGAEVLNKIMIPGKCLAAPAIWDGKVFLMTKAGLYCFGDGSQSDLPDWPRPKTPVIGQAAKLQVLPSEILLGPGESQNMSLRTLDADGHLVREVSAGEASWQKFIPPTAKVKIKLKGELNQKGVFTATRENTFSAGAIKATYQGMSGTTRGRTMTGLPFKEDFESFVPKVPHKLEKGVKFAFPPLPWIGARFKWEIRELDGNRVLAKTLDRVLFQRAITFLGSPNMSGYTMAVDVMSDGNRRIMSTGGMINQRYVIALKGNWQQIEISSNHDRIKESVPFKWKAKTWYRLMSRVDLNPDGSGVVRAKAWKRGNPEPKNWMIEVKHKQAHTHGSPGLFGFSPQSKKRVYLDNVSIEKNK